MTDHRQMSARMREGRKKAFIVHFKRLRSQTLAAKRINVDRTTVGKWLRKDARFKAAYESAVEEVIDAVELELMRLGDGTYSKPIASGGKIVGEERIRSEKALLAVLAAYRPRYAARQQVELTGAVGVGLAAKVKISAEAERTMIEQAAAFLVEAGVGLSHEELAARADAAAHPENTYSALDDYNFRTKTLPAFQPPASEDKAGA